MNLFLILKFFISRYLQKASLCLSVLGMSERLVLQNVFQFDLCFTVFTVLSVLMVFTSGCNSTV